jgi:glycosyltransferase involved in cell wall biosynthesis
MLSIAVIIPTYNAEKWIGRAIAGVLNQSFKPSEIIVVDDGSIDRTSAIVKRMCSRVRYIYQDNSGPAVARNHGIEESSGEWVAFLDADDEWFPNWVRTHQRVLNISPESMWSCCNFEYAGDGSQRNIMANESVSCEGAIRYFDAVLRGIRFQTSGFLIHRSVFDEVGMFKSEMRSGQDMDLWSRIAMRYSYIAYSSDVCYRFWQDNVSSIIKTKRSRDLQVKNICKNILLAQSLGEDVISTYYPYARKRVVSYILRAAARKVQLSRKILDKAKTIFPLTLCERTQAAMLKVLPAPIAGRVVGWLVDYFPSVKMAQVRQEKWATYRAYISEKSRC